MITTPSEQLYSTLLEQRPLIPVWKEPAAQMDLYPGDHAFGEPFEYLLTAPKEVFLPDAILSHVVQVSWEDQPATDEPPIAYVSLGRTVQHLNDRTGYIRAKLTYTLTKSLVNDPDFGSLRVARVATLEAKGTDLEHFIKEDKVDTFLDSWRNIRTIHNKPIDPREEPNRLLEIVTSSQLLTVS